MKGKRTATPLTGIAGVLLLLGILIALNVVFSELRLRQDMTEQKIYTLSPGTEELLGGLERNVVLKFYFSKSNENVPIPLKNYAQRVEDLLREYESHGQGRIKVETYDPKPDSEAEEWAQRYGLTAQSLGVLGSRPDFYLGLAAISGRREGAVPFFAPGVEPQLEYLVTQLIYRTAQAGRSKIGILSSLPVMGAPDTPYSRMQDLDTTGWVAIEELKKQYELVSLGLSDKEIPPDLAAVILIHPRDVSDAVLFALDQYLLRGGRLLVFIDPFCLAEKETTVDRTFRAASSQINRLSRAWGLEMSPDEVVADYKAASLVTLASGGSERLLTWLSLRGDEISREEVATGSLEIMMMPLAGGFTGTPSEALTMSTLVCTSDDAAFVDTIAAAQRGPELMKDARLRGTLPLAVRLTGRFATAFPEGPPRKEDEGGNGAGPEWLKESAEEGAVVLVSDVDLIYDRFCVRKIGFFGQPLYAPANDNLNFLLNLVEELSGSGALIGLRSRGTFDRPFHKVIELERLAQKRWQQEELALTRKLREMQARLDELQQAKSDDQRFILSPEQKREIESFRKQRFETQKKLKEVRKNLRRDIEGLGLRLKVLNAGLVPVLVIAYGLLHGWRRRKKAAAPPGRDGLPAGG